MLSLSDSSVFVTLISGERSEKAAKKQPTSLDTTTSISSSGSSSKIPIPDFLSVKDPLERKGLRPSLPDSVASANAQVTYDQRVQLLLVATAQYFSSACN